MLRQIAVFSPLPLDSLKVFAYLCRRETFKPGDLLFQQNEDDGQAFYLISGTAVLVHDSETGRQEIIERNAGDFIGMLALLGKMPRLFSLEARTDTTGLVMSRDKFAKAMEQFPELMPKILYALVNRIYRWEKRLLADQAETCGHCLKRAGVSLI